jgi:N-acetylneuraminic acid mutarotase
MFWQPRQLVTALGALLVLACESGTGPSPSNWVQRAPLPGGPLIGAASFVVHDKLYVGAGLRRTFANSFYEYDPTPNRWREVASLPAEVRWNGVGFAIADYGYVGLGYNCIGVGSCTFRYFDDLWRYDPQNDSWGRAADFPGSGRAFASAFVIGEKAYVTGRSSTGEHDMWEYDPAGNRWTRKADYPGGCAGRATAFSTAGKGYIGLGYSDGACNDFWQYDPSVDSWTAIATFPGVARYDALGFSLDDAPFVAGGADGARDPAYLTDLWTYDPAGDTWTPLPTAYPGKGRSEMTAGVLAGRVFLGLGTDNWLGGMENRFDDWWEYVPDR